MIRMLFGKMAIILKSTAGHYDPNSKTWILDDITSLCIDTGDPNSVFENESFPNGSRINMGVYGNTTEASKSPEEPVLPFQKLQGN